MIELSEDLLFVDTETTGLTMNHDVWEIAYAAGDGRIFDYIVEHDLRNSDPKALELNGYFNRGFKAYKTPDYQIKPNFVGKTIVGANPSFDAYRLAQRWGEAPWHYRLVDVESMAVPLLGLTKPLGLKGLVDALSVLGYNIPENDHTAAGDVATAREVYRSLMSMGANPRREGW